MNRISLVLIITSFALIVNCLQTRQKSKIRSKNGKANNLTLRALEHVHQIKSKEALRTTRINTRAESSEKYDLNETMKITPYNIRSIFEHYAKSLTDYKMEVVLLNKTVERNDIILLKMKNDTVETKGEDDTNTEKTTPTDKFVNEPPVKKIVFIVHALNTVGFYENPALSSNQLLFQIISCYAKHLDKFDIYLMPLANPDGASALMRDERWSKNNSPQSACNGVALDRNFDVAWSSVVENSCSPFYAGREPFSEIETKTIRQVLSLNQARLYAYIHVRSASDSAFSKKGEALLFPYGYTDAQSQEEDKFLEIQNDIEELAAQGSQIMRFQCEPMYKWYGGPVNGSSVDFAYKVFGLPYALEALIQPYSDLDVTEASLKVVWGRVLDIIFNRMAKSLSNS